MQGLQSSGAFICWDENIFPSQIDWRSCQCVAYWRVKAELDERETYLVAAQGGLLKLLGNYEIIAVWCKPEEKKSNVFAKNKMWALTSSA